MLTIENFGPVKAMHQGIDRLWLKPFMTVRCYSIDGILVDGGLPHFQKHILQFCRDEGVHQVYITHHHEDHSANSAFLKVNGYPVFGSNQAQDIMKTGFTQKAYQKLVWGSAKRGNLDRFSSEVIETSRYKFEIIDAPGHCFDQVVFYEPNQGWLFAGDAFLGEAIKWFRADEDFSITVRTLKKLTQLDIGDLFCAHRPVLGRGREALANKLKYLVELEQKVKLLQQKGYSLRHITREVLGKESLLMSLITFGDVSKKNIIYSILYGPRLRDQSSLNEALT